MIVSSPRGGDWSGNLVDFYYEVIERLARRFPSPFSTDETGTRHGARNPVTEAVNEAVANALVHAYHGANSGITIVLTPDDLVVSNPGTLLIDHDVAIAGGFSEARNPTLMRLFGFVGASDRAGSGLQMIYATWRDLLHARPMLAEQHHPARVVLRMPLAGIFDAIDQGRTNAADVVRIDDAEIVELLAQVPDGLTPRDLARRTGLSMRVAQKRLKALHDAGAASRIKAGRTYSYRVR